MSEYERGVEANFRILLPKRTWKQIQQKAHALGLSCYRPPARPAEETRKAKREGMARLRAKDIQVARAKGRAHHAKHRERHNTKMRAYTSRRFFWKREQHLRGKDKATARQLALLWKQQRGICALTGRRLDRSAQIDHKLPKARGGSDQIENLQWVCEEANIAKRHLTDEEFIVLCGDVLRWIGERIAQVSQIVAPSDGRREL